MTTPNTGRPQLLIVTNEADPHADAVIRILEARGRIEPVRLNTNDLLDDWTFRTEWHGDGSISTGSIRLRRSGRTADRARVLWWRKPLDLTPPAALQDVEAQRFARRESATVLRSIGATFPQARWVNDPNAMSAIGRKPDQVAIARAVGLPIPETLLTNDPEAVTAFVASHERVIIKPLDTDGFVRDGRRLGLFTNRITAAEAAKVAHLAPLAPVFLQRELVKQREFRVTVIGRRVIACAIDASAHPSAAIDWRATPPDRLPHVIVEIAPALEAALRAFLEACGLFFGAFDLIEEPDGVVRFLELNPGGQYLWIEHITGTPLSSMMCDLIEELADVA